MGQNIKIMWLRKPEDHDYAAAMSFLSLLYEKKIAAQKVQKLKQAGVNCFKSNIENQQLSC